MATLREIIGHFTGRGGGSVPPPVNEPPPIVFNPTTNLPSVQSTVARAEWHAEQATARAQADWQAEVIRHQREEVHYGHQRGSVPLGVDPRSVPPPRRTRGAGGGDRPFLLWPGQRDEGGRVPFIPWPGSGRDTHQGGRTPFQPHPGDDRYDQYGNRVK
jgi:hypothetical protein